MFDFQRYLDLFRNAIRGLLMHLCDIPQDKIPFVEIPTGLPLVYDPTQRKIRLLQDGDIGTKINPLEKYKFGTAPELLFKLHPSKTDYDRMTSISNVDAELRTKTQTPYWDDIMIKSRK